MKILFNFIKTLFKAILSFVSKGEGAVKKEFGIDIYKASVQELKNKHKEINEDLIDIETEEAFSVKQLETLRDSLPNLKKEIQKARKEKDKVKFSKLALELSSLTKKIKAVEDMLVTIRQSKEKVQNYAKSIEIAMKEKEIKLDELEFKDNATKSMQSIQTVISNIGYVDGISEMKDIEDSINKEFIRANIKTDVLDRNATSLDSIASFDTEEEMDAFLKEIGVEETKSTSKKSK